MIGGQAGSRSPTGPCRSRPRDRSAVLSYPRSHVSSGGAAGLGRAPRPRRWPSTSPSTTPSPRTTSGGARASPSGSTSPGPGRSSPATTSPTSPGSWATTTCGSPRCGRPRPTWPATTASPGSSTTTTGSTGGGSSSDPSTRCWPRARPTSPSPCAGPTRSGPATGTARADGVLMPQELQRRGRPGPHPLAVRGLRRRPLHQDRRPAADARLPPELLPDARRTTDLWRAEAQTAGFPDLYLVWVEGWGPPPAGPEAFGFDATVGFMPPDHRAGCFTPLASVRGPPGARLRVRLRERAEGSRAPPWRRFPSVMVGMGQHGPAPRGATIFTGATPEAYARVARAGRSTRWPTVRRRGALPVRRWPGTSGPRATTSSRTSTSGGPSWRPPGPC